MSYYIPPRFLDKLAIHLTKNYLNLLGVRVPLILGIHGRKGEGKTFMCELVFKRMGIGVVYMSAGELESPDAGDPARLIRLRYREAGEWSRVHGRMAALMINDVDAGIGRVDQHTQYTVNTQLVNATLMNIADNPTNVQLPGSYDQEPTQRIPIILTGNDFSTLYAPLIRDGRMEKFFWDPDRTDRIGIVSGIFATDAIAQSEIEKLIDTFPDQSLDFFNALRSRLFDEQVRQFIHNIGFEKISQRVANAATPPEFSKPDFGLPHLLDMGHQMVREQKRIQELRLVEEYNQALRGHSQPHSPQPDSPATEPSYFMYYGNANSEKSSQAEPSDHANGQSQQRTTSTQRQVIDSSAATEISQILNRGQRVGIEYVDERRFRTGAWQIFGTYQGNPQDAIAALETCLAEHHNDYIRLVGIEPSSRKRIAETIIQRPQK
jgi:ribulose bisphosphate carboxylase small subunit